MGNDGGSIAKRDDLVRTKAKAEKADERNRELARWALCALSKVSVLPCVYPYLYDHLDDEFY